MKERKEGWRHLFKLVFFLDDRSQDGIQQVLHAHFSASPISTRCPFGRNKGGLEGRLFFGFWYVTSALLGHPPVSLPVLIKTIRCALHEGHQEFCARLVSDRPSLVSLLHLEVPPQRHTHTL